MPNYVISQAPGKVVLRNYEGVITTYTEPTDYKADKCNCKYCQENKECEGVVSLLEGKAMTIQPAHLAREDRAVKYRAKMAKKAAKPAAKKAVKPAAKKVAKKK